MKQLILLIITLLALNGCAHVISSETRATVDTTVSNQRLFGDPDLYRGRIVILGGVIANARNAAEGTFLEVVQKPLDDRGRPEETDFSQGRFLALHQGFLDTAIFIPGRQVTVAGEVAGWQEGKIGEMNYRYPLIRSREIHLVERTSDGGTGIPISVGIGIFKGF
jgi:outer membrane lipoprotein